MIKTKYTLALSFIIVLITTYSSFGQVKGFSQNSYEKILEGEKTLNTTENLLNKETTPVGNIVESEHYYIGPGDVLLLQNLSMLPESQPIVVSPEVSVVLPRFGIIDLKNKTLQEARNIILEKIKERNPQALAYITLYQPRSVIIHIEGNVSIPGTFTFPASYRVSNALAIANRANTSQLSNQQASYLYDVQKRNREREKDNSNVGISNSMNYSQRNICIYNIDGSSSVCDLVRSVATNDINNDPYIKEGQTIYVPFPPKDFSVISIFGAVNKQGVITYKPGDKASDLLKLGYGLSPDADKQNVLITIPAQNIKEKLIIDDNLNIIGNDYELSPGSIITVGQKSITQTVENGIVAISGNIKNPGAYIISTGKTRLKDIVNLAGGFSDKAYLPLAYIVRHSDENLPTDDIRTRRSKSFQYSDLTMEDTTRYAIDIENRQSNVSCDFVAAFSDNSERDNIILQDGDLIVIPSKPTHVYVWGQVNQPGYVPFKDNMNMDWYIEQAGGIAQGGEEGRARIIRGKNKVWVKGKSDVMVYAGDEVYVPRPPDVPPGTQIQKYAVIATVLSTVTVLINVFYNMLNK